jgi:hypothetical protein
MSDQLDLDLDNDSPLLGSAKNERTLMAYNFFSLTREHQTELPRYDDGKISIEVVGTKFGIANIWDKEVLIYLESLLQDRINRGEVLSPIFQFTANDLFRITGTKAAGTAYERLEAALDRLKSTTIKTNLLDDDGESGETSGFSSSVSFRGRNTRCWTSSSFRTHKLLCFAPKADRTDPVAPACPAGREGVPDQSGRHAAQHDRRQPAALDPRPVTTQAGDPSSSGDRRQQ